MNDDADLQQLRDRLAVEAVLMRYFHAADRGQRDEVRGCFTEDVWAQYEGRPLVQGVDALMDQIALFENLRTGATRISTHFAGNLVFRELSGDFAETENNVFAFLASADGSKVAARSLRYLDRLRKVQGQWKIFARVHTLDWSCDMPSVFARPFGEKVIEIPAHWPAH